MCERRDEHEPALEGDAGAEALAAEIAGLRAERLIHQAQIEGLLEERRAERETLDRLFRSWSWRITRPLRALHVAVGRLTSRRRRGAVELAAARALARAPRRRMLIASDGRRTMLPLVRELGWEVTCVELGATPEPGGSPATGIGWICDIPTIARHLEAEGASYAAAVLSAPEVMFELAPLARASMPFARLFYDTAADERDADPVGENESPGDAASRRERLERANLEAADEVLVATPAEAQRIRRLVPQLPVRVIDAASLRSMLTALELETGRP